MADVQVMLPHTSIPSLASVPRPAPTPRPHRSQQKLASYGPLVHGKRRSLEPRPFKDILVDYWTSKIFSIISDGPAGGFVRYRITPRNELYVDRTGNRADLEDVVHDFLPKDAPCYMAYKLRYQSGDSERTKVIWAVWTPETTVPKETAMYLQGLAGTLIGLNCPSSIPIVEAKASTDVTFESIAGQISPRPSSISSSHRTTSFTGRMTPSDNSSTNTSTSIGDTKV